MRTFADAPMRVRLTLTVAVAGAMVVFVPLAPARVVAQQPAFRSTTEAVMVTATVIDKEGRLVTDLTRNDFEIRDNGEVRDITVFRNDVVPFALAVMFDISGSVLWNIENVYAMRQGVSELVARFKPGDRAKIGTFTNMASISPRFTANRQTLLGWVNATIGGAGMQCTAPPARAGGSAVWDAVECGIEAVAADAETPRRVVMVVTDGVDNASVRTPADLQRRAARYGVMVYAVGVFGIEGLDSEPLRRLATESGGGYFRLVDRGDLPATFARVADELRHQYVFGFTPSSSDPSAHSLEVRVPGRDVTTRARRVYMQALPSAPATVRAEAAAPAVSSIPAEDVARNQTTTAMLDRYARGDAASGSFARLTDDELWSEVRDLRRVAPGWIRANGGDAEARRRLAVATYVLELIDAQGALPWPPALSAFDLLEWACELLREAPPAPAERSWHLASVALLERLETLGAGQSRSRPYRSSADQYGTDSDPVTIDAADFLTNHLAHAEQRVPGEARWVLARAVAQELRTWPESRDDKAFSVPSALASRISARFQEAAAHESVRPEAHIRWGYFELRRGNATAALAHFEQAGAPDDVALRYWLHLFRGRALEQAHRPADAIASYRLAMSAAPYAQSAALSLGAALVADHHPSEAASLVSRTLAIHPVPMDPWTLYTAADYRFWSQLIADLRAAIAQ